MLTLMGNTKVLTAKEVVNLFNTVSAGGFKVVDSLPELTVAKKGVTYYRRTNEKYIDDAGKERAVLVPYVLGDDPDTGDLCWYTSGAGTFNYENMRNLPSINGEKFLRDMDEAKARAEVSEDGASGGYGLSIMDDEIMKIVSDEMDGD